MSNPETDAFSTAMLTGLGFKGAAIGAAVGKKVGAASEFQRGT
jgi:hypothetical protein